MTFKTVEQMEAEYEELKEEYHKAFVAGGLDERDLIVAWLRSPRGDAWLGYEDQAIEAGEHLK